VNPLRALWHVLVPPPPPPSRVLLLDIETREARLITATIGRSGRVVRYPDGAALSPQWWTLRDEPGRRLAVLRAHDWRPLALEGESLRAIPYSAEEFRGALDSEIPLAILHAPEMDWKVVAIVILGLVAVVAAVT